MAKLLCFSLHWEKCFDTLTGICYLLMLSYSQSLAISKNIKPLLNNLSRVHIWTSRHWIFHGQTLLVLATLLNTKRHKVQFKNFTVHQLRKTEAKKSQFITSSHTPYIHVIRYTNGVSQGSILSPTLFNLYPTSTRWDSHIILRRRYHSLSTTPQLWDRRHTSTRMPTHTRNVAPNKQTKGLHNKIHTHIPTHVYTHMYTHTPTHTNG